jgi:hypothetical protein
LVINEIQAQTPQYQTFFYGQNKQMPIQNNNNLTKQNIVFDEVGKLALNLKYSLFFISEHISGGRVTDTDGDCKICYTIMNMLLDNSYISYGKSDPHVVYLHKLF